MINCTDKKNLLIFIAVNMYIHMLCALLINVMDNVNNNRTL